MLYRIPRPPRLGIGLSLLALVGFLIAGCGGGSQEEKSAPPPVVGSFVAVVAAGP